MSRLAAKSKLLFYPTPISQMELIASYIRASGVGTILDPCAGNGGPIAYLANKLRLTSFANEIDPDRYEEAAGKVDHAVCGARELLDVEGQFNIIFDNPPYDRSITGERMESQHIKRDLGLLAPYGLGIWVVPESIVNYDLCLLLCQELTEVLVRRFTQPEYDQFKQVVIFGKKREKTNTYTYSLVSDLQHEILQGPPLLADREVIFSYTNKAKAISRFSTVLHNPTVVLAEIETHGVQNSQAWETMFGIEKSSIVDFKPLLPLASGHMAFVIAAGIVDGTKVAIDEHIHILKGSTKKRVKVIETKEVVGGKTKTITRERERLSHTLTALNLENGSVVEYDSLKDMDSFSGFLIEHQETLIDMVEETYPPLFNPEVDMPIWAEAFSKIHAPGLLPGQKPEDANGLLPAQQVRAAGMVTKLDTDKAVVLVGEMGAGKTAVSQAVAALAGTGNWKLIVLCPSQIVHKWKREAEKILADFNVKAHVIGQKRKQPDGIGYRYTSDMDDQEMDLTTCDEDIKKRIEKMQEIIDTKVAWRNSMMVKPPIADVLAALRHSMWLLYHKSKQRKVGKPILDTIRAMDEENPSILVMSYETAKNGARWEHAVTKHVQRFPREIQEMKVTKSDYFPYEERELVTRIEYVQQQVLKCPNCGLALTGDLGYIQNCDLGKKKRVCAECGGRLWQQIPFKYGGRTAVADFLNRHYSGRYSLILDECHHSKGADTDTGYASTDLVAGAKKVVAMTGTIYSGKASSVFYLMYRLLPKFRSLYEYNEVQRFVEHHGLQETTTTNTQQEKWSSAYGYNRGNVRTKEIPGVSPGMVTMLLPNTAFIKLADMGIHLPKYTEERLPIQVDDRLETGMADLDKIYEEAKQLARKGRPGLLSAWLHASLGWLDCPIKETLEVKDKTGEVIASFGISGVLDRPDEILDEPLAKDKALLLLTIDKLSQGRGVGIYFSQINKRDWMTRMAKIFKAEGIYCEVLRRSTCKPDEREAWYRGFIDRCKSNGDQPPVLLTNGNLVKEGLDLIELPSLVETGIEYNINNLRQRDRRSFRLTQDQPVDVTFLYYEDSYQETALQYIASKLKAALMVDGDLVEGLGAMDMDDGNMMDMLMKAVSGRERPGWSGMETVTFSKPLVIDQDPVSPLDFREIVVGKINKQQEIQLSFL